MEHVIAKLDAENNTHVAKEAETNAVLGSHV